MLRVDAKIPHAAVFAVHAVRSLPVDRFVWIHVARVIKAAADLENAAHAALSDPAYERLHRRKKRKLAGAPGNDTGVLRNCL